MATSPRKQIVMDVCKKYPDADNRTLARLLHEEYPQEFSDVEKARSSVRYYRGLKGKKSRAAMPDKSAHKKPGKPHTIKFPAGDRQVRRDMRIRQPGRYLVISDVHVPYHSEQALEAALRYAVDHKCEHLYINGDFYDFYKLSRWSQDPRMRDPHAELKIGQEVLDVFNQYFTGSDCIKIFKTGNHEERYEKYLFERAKALVGLEDFELKKILRLKQNGFRHVKSKQVCHLGKLPILHGHELPKGLTDPVNIGRGVYLRAAETAMVGHWHRSSTHVETAGLRERLMPCYSLGCLCDLSPDYARINKWNHGFAIVDINSAGHYSCKTC